jgi:hypothetical protein
MPRTGWSPSTVPGAVPYGADETVYLIIDRFRSGTVYRETEIERTDLETIISDFLSGQFNDPVQVVAFNTLEHWAADVSGDMAAEIQTRCDIRGEGVPDYLSDFMRSYSGPNRQLTFRLA